ncbi:Cell division protein FtsL [hydrothermal vent metagenome]|uniref:Cell division protein FtsL n=1 Tax=hydrothermal vent metagenome TaxID=652676 RepID=A0A3B1AY99_9ZZZZ
MKYGQPVFLLGLMLAVLSSGIGVVYAKFASRKHFVELQTLHAERDSINVEWGRLQLEQSTWATHGRVEQIARTKLDMHIPTASEVVVITP